MRIPRYFLRELRFIDPRYYVDKQGKSYFIRYYNEEQREIRSVDVFDQLNDTALDWLRYRKWLGRVYRTPEGPDRWLNKFREERRRAKQKESQVAMDMITEGVMKAHKLLTTETAS